MTLTLCLGVTMQNSHPIPIQETVDWPVVPVRGSTVKFRGTRYDVMSVFHDFDHQEIRVSLLPAQNPLNNEPDKPA